MSSPIATSPLSLSDGIRQALINEIEESLSQASKNQLGKSKIQESIFRICNDKDFEITNELLDFTMKNGLDPTYRDLNDNSGVKTNLLNNSNFPEGNQDYSIIQQQIYGYLLSVDLIEIGLITQEEEDEDILDIHNSNFSSISSLDKVRSLNFPKNMFDTLLVPLKSNRPILHRLLNQLISFNNSSKPKRKKSRKDKRKDKKEKRTLDISPIPNIVPHMSPMNLELSSPPIIHYESDFFSSYDDRSNLVEDAKSTISREDHIKEKISLYVCKCIAEGTVSSYLCALLYLIHLWKSRSDIIEELPLGNVIASLFEISLETTIKQKTHSPLSVLLLSKEEIAQRAKAVEPSKDMEIQSTSESTSVPNHDSKEGINDSKLNEVNTSMIVTTVDEEFSEEEMLAQALALSLTNVEATLISNDSILNSDEVVATLVDLATIDTIPIKNEYQMEKDEEHDEILPSSSSKLDPLCSQGPFEYLSELSHCKNKSNSISMLAIITCLTMILSVNCDKYLSECSAAELQVVDSTNDLHILKDNQFSKKDQIITNIELDIQPNQFVFNSIEYIFDMLLSVSPSSCSHTMEEKSFVYIIFWLKFNFLKILRAHLKSIHQLNLMNNLSLLGLNYSNEVSFNVSFLQIDPSNLDIPSNVITSNVSTSVVFKQLIALLDLINIKLLSIHPDRSIENNFETDSMDLFSRKVLSNNHDNDSNNISIQYSFLSHSVRIQAIKTFVQGFNIFVVNPKDKELLLQDLFHHTTGSLQSLSIFTLSTYPLHKDLPTDYYDVYLLQELCLFGSIHGYGFNLSIDKDIALNKNLSIDSNLGIEIENIKGNNRNKEKSEYVSIFLLNHKSYIIAYESIEIILIQRFYNNFLNYSCNNKLFDDSINNDNKYMCDRSKYLYWGEFKLLTSIHNSHINLFLSDSNYFNDQKLLSTFLLKLSNSKPSYQFSLSLSSSTNNFNSDLSIISSNDETTITHIGPKSWLTVPCAQIILPNSGIYEFKFRIDKCDRGQVFVGCMTVENSIAFKESCYLGIDKQSWGLMGNSSLWYNKSKIKADYSSGFSSRSIVVLKYDSNLSTISYNINGTDSDVAFSNIPREPIYIAVTLHDKDDRITLLSAKKVITPQNKKHNDTENCRENLFSTYKLSLPFIRYSQILLTYADKVLMNIQKNYKISQEWICLSHPFINVLLASLISAINLTNLNGCQGNLLSFQLLPYLTVISRRLVDLFESSSNLSNYSTVVSIFPSIWRFHRENVSNNKSDYYLTLNDNTKVSSYSTTKQNKSSLVYSVINAQTENSELKLKGTCYGNRIKFVEEWENGNLNVVEGRISLCGSMIIGKYVEMKGCSTIPSIGTSIIAKAQPLPEDFISKGFKYKEQIYVYTNILAQLCLRGCSRLSGTFILGIPMSISQDHTINDMDMIDETLPSSGESDISERDGDDSTLPFNATGNNFEADKWIQSNLFSNGMYLSKDIISQFIERTRIYTTCYIVGELHDSKNSKYNTKSIAEIASPNNAYQGLIDWWLEFNLPILLNYGNEHSFKSNTFFYQLMNSIGDGGVLDDYLILHTNQTMLTKVGGQVVQTARKFILSVLILHTGCIPLCQTQIEVIEKNRVNMTSIRPSIILINVWKACQRIIEHILRQKQSTGLSYSSVCKVYLEKSEFLTNIQPNQLSVVISESLLDLSNDLVSKDNLTSIPNEASNDIIQDANKIINEISDFYLSNIRDMKIMTKKLFDNTITGLSRIVGFKSYKFMIDKLDSLPVSSVNNSFSQVSSISFQKAIIEFLTLSLYGLNDLSNEKLLSAVPVSSLDSSDESSDKLTMGHYLCNISGLPSLLLNQLRAAFESLYEFITQLLSKCTWACDYDGQYVTLASWGISIMPSDHQFLNHVGIFRILQTLLDDVRLNFSKNINVQPIELKELIKVNSPDGPFANEFIILTNNRLSQLALKIMYSLASQVAFVKDYPLNISISPTSAPKLQRTLSGPDTLSLSLFEMLYSELFNGMKRLMKVTISDSWKKECCENDDTKNLKFKPSYLTDSNEDSLDGEGYIGRILKLLYFVSSSKTCHHSLSSSKWFTLLIASIGCGTLITQRRIFRLLRRLLSNTLPNYFQAYITSIFNDREDFVQSDNPLDDDDIKLLVNSQNQDSSLGLINFLLEAMILIQPIYPSDDSIQDNKEFLKKKLIDYYQSTKLSSFIAAEALVVIRVLQGIPAWRKSINESLKSIFVSNKIDSISGIKLHKSSNLYSNMQMVISIAGVLGGHVDRFRSGGIVSIKPFTLANQSDTLANRLASMSHTSGMLIWQSASGENIEVVLMERGINIVKNSIDSSEKLVHFTTSVNGTLPVRGIRLNVSDVSPSYDVPALSEFISIDLFTMSILQDVVCNAIPWLVNHFTSNKSTEKNSFVLEPTFPISQIDKKINRWVRSDETIRGNTFNIDYMDYEVNEDRENDDEDQLHSDDDDDDDDADSFSPENRETMMDIQDPSKDSEQLLLPNTMDTEQQDQMSSYLNRDNKKMLTEQQQQGESAETDDDVIYSYGRVSSLKAMSVCMQNIDLVSKYLELYPLSILELLKLSLVQISTGLQSFELMEEKWVTYCESYCLFSKTTVTQISTSTNEIETSSIASPETVEIVRPNPSREGTASRLAEAAAAVFSSYSSRNIDPAAKAEAIAQMMDMGLPKEWCETALKRCRYNVEMAINMCFEHGDDMARFVAEDNLNQSTSIASRERDMFFRSGRRPTGGDDLSPAPADYVSMGSLARVLVGSRATSRRDPASDPNTAIRQLLEMGFPASWCARAMDASSNDVAGALGWILSHGDELSSGIDNNAGSTKSSNSNVPSTVDSGPTNVSSGLTPDTVSIINPLVSVSGAASVSPDLICVVADEGFPSVGCRQFPVSSGKWYYELLLLSSGCIQVGWVDLAFTGAADNGQGVGDDIHSWAYDGWRTHLWHEISTDWGGRWSAGDVVGCAIDLDNLSMSFYLNGFGQEVGMGLAFSGFKFHGGVYPCISFNKRERVQFNFGSSPFRFSPPIGYSPFNDHVVSLLNSFNENIPKLYNISLNDSIFNYAVSDNSSLESLMSKIPIDNMEICKGDKLSNPLKRYFNDDTNKNIDKNDKKNLQKNFKSKDKIKDSLLTTSTELCILYIRQIFLRIILSIPKLSDNHMDIVLKICNETNILNDWIIDSIPNQHNQKLVDIKNMNLSSFEGVLLLIRLSSYFTSRTKTYIQTISTSSSATNYHKQSESVLNVGGTPLLEDLRSSISKLILYNTTKSTTSNPYSFIYLLIDQVLIDTTNCIQRKVVDDWKNDFNCLSPVVIISQDTYSTDVLSVPSLHYSTWITNFGSVIIDWLKRLVCNWSVGLNCSNVSVKTCIFTIISSIIQDISTNIKFLSLPKSGIISIIKVLPLSRLKNMVLERLNSERLNHPIYTEYIQSVLELYICIQYCYFKYLPEDHKSADFIDNPLCETKDDESDSSFNWEAVSGKVFSNNDDWITMTGNVKQDELKGFTPNDRKISERTDFPPELMIGCKVCRLYPLEKLNSLNLDKDSKDQMDQSKEEITDEKIISKDETAPESRYEIGTVIGISSWENDLPGTAREIKWEDGSTETVKWGANGCEFDVTHVKIVDNKIKVKYINPIPLSARILNTNFKNSVSFGIIIRVRKQQKSFSDSDKISNRLIGVMEWPDFNAVVYVKGFIYSDSTWVLIDYKLLSGPNDTTWSIRFGESNWRPGTVYCFSVPVDELRKPILGTYTSPINCGNLHTSITGSITVQKQRLFLFDNKFYSSNILPSWDFLSINKSVSTSGQGCAFGNIGFSSGIHYWELKIEQAEVGSIFIGVSEKPGMPGLASSLKCIKWMGCGFVSNRTSYKSGSERIAVYGDHFHTGDLIGVLLDMNKGRLSFFLDGMKYGEHTLADLGEAFDGLSTPNKVRPKTLFPVVGLSRYQDRVTILPRWLSTIGGSSEEELFLISRVSRLLISWSFERPTSKPLDMNIWIYKDAWRDWRKWIANQSIRIKTRCRIANMIIDISPRSCVIASLYLGLPTALFHGDHVIFSKSSGRKLETKEEVVILGVYNNQLWYRQDSQQEGRYVGESTAVAWALVQSDVEGLTILRRSYILSNSLPSSVINLPLPRLPMFRGGLVTLILQSGAAMRNGLEIDTSDVLKEIAPNTTVFAIEKRVNSSNIVRYFVFYDGEFGWISERMRGGAEEVIVHINQNNSNEEIEKYREEVIKSANELGIKDRIIWDEVNTIEEAMMLWELQIRQQGHSKLFEKNNLLYSKSKDDIKNEDDIFSFEKYLLLSTTIDGEKNWSVEADMQLAEIITKCAAKQGVSPLNLNCNSLIDILKTIDIPTSMLYNINPDRAIARAALLRTANQIISYALPYLNITQLEEKMYRDVHGTDIEIEISPTILPPSALGNDSPEQQDKTTISSWSPPSWGRRLRSMRRILFGQTKRLFWESILDYTTTITPLHQDEYEDPREIKTISINRIKATATKLVGINSMYDRIRQSVFGQLHKELRSWSDGSFRRSYVSKGHGGQKRAFKVKFLGEGVNDYGGPYRAVFEQIIDELQCDRLVSKSTEKCLLPLLTPSNNRLSSIGFIQDKFLLSISPAISSVTHELMNFFGKLLGTAVRHNLNLALDLSMLVYRPLVKLPLSLVHLETVDSLLTKSLNEIIKKGLEIESDYNKGLIDHSNGLSYQPIEWEDLIFSIYLPDGSRVPLIPNGEDEPVNLGNWRTYVSLVEKCRLTESISMFKQLRDGLQSVLPTELLPLFTSNELEQIVSGNSIVDISLLKQCTEYEDIASDSLVVQNFWKVLEEFSPEEKTLFLRFVWARSRMPSSAQDLPMNFKLQGAQGDAKVYPDKYLPHAQTCFFSLSLPNYTTKEILREKLIYAIHNSPNMDADVRLHNAEGWADA